MQKIRVIIVDDHDFFRLGVRATIEAHHPDIAIVGEAKCGADFFALLKTTTADLVLLDIMLPDMSGIEIAHCLKKEYPEVKILVISSETSTPTIEKMLEVGVEGFISKFESDINVFAEAIHSIMQGLEYFGKDIFHVLSRTYLAKKQTTQVTPEFSEHEKRIIEYCHEGLTGKQIACHLNLSHKTIEWHKTNIFRKLDINNKVELVRFAMKNGIIRAGC